MLSVLVKHYYKIVNHLPINIIEIDTAYNNNNYQMFNL